MAAVTIDDTPAVVFGDTIEARDEHAGYLMAMEKTIDQFQAFRRPSTGHRHTAEQGPRHRHIKCRRYSFARNIRHDESRFTGIDFEGIVKITANRFGRFHRRMNFKPNFGGKGFRQYSPLDVAGNIDFALQGRILGLGLPVAPPPLHFFDYPIDGD